MVTLVALSGASTGSAVNVALAIEVELLIVTVIVYCPNCE